MAKPIVVEGAQFEIYEGGVLNANGSVAVSSLCTPCSKVSIDGKKAYAGTLLVEVSKFTSSVLTNWVPQSGSTTTPAGVISPGSIVSTVTKASTTEGKFFLEGDQAAAVTIYGQISTSSGTSSATTVVTIKIKDAGQNVVNAT